MYVSVKVPTISGLTKTINYPVDLSQGCMLSHILFAIFINELNDLFSNSYVRGIQFIPNT